MRSAIEGLRNRVNDDAQQLANLVGRFPQFKPRQLESVLSACDGDGDKAASLILKSLENTHECSDCRSAREGRELQRTKEMSRAAARRATDKSRLGDYM